MIEMMFGGNRGRRWLAGGVLCTVLAPSLAAQTGFGTRQDHLEEVYGHELSAANLEEIDSWHQDEIDWWIDEERNLESWAKIRDVHRLANNSAELLTDPRDHEELFGVTLQTSADPTALGTLAFDIRLRPDLYTIVDLVRHELDPLFEQQLAFHPAALDVRQELRKITKGLKVPEVFPWLVTAQQTQRLVTSSIEGDAAEFIEKALTHLYSEALRSSAEVANDLLAAEFLVDDQLSAYAGVDLRVEYVRLLGDRELELFQASLERATNFLQALAPAHRTYFLRYLLETQTRGTLTGVPLVDPAENHAFFDSLDLELRGFQTSYAQQPGSGIVVTASASAYTFEWVQRGRTGTSTYEPIIGGDIEYWDDGENTCAIAVPGEIGIRGDKARFDMRVGGTLHRYLRSLEATVTWNPTLKHEGGTTYPSAASSQTCLFGEGHLVGNTIQCSVEMTIPQDWDDLTLPGKYEVVPNTEARTAMVLPAVFNSLTWASQTQTTASLTAQGLGYQSTFSRTLAGSVRIWTIQYGPMEKGPFSWGYRSGTVDLRDCVEEEEEEEPCPEGTVLNEETGACECPGSLIGPFAEEPFCRTICEVYPAHCEEPIHDDGPGRRGIAARDLVQLLHLTNDGASSLDHAVRCSADQIFVCTERYDEELETLIVECTWQHTCEPRAGKTIDCSDPAWWLYCGDWELVDEMPADIVAAATCSLGDERCRSANESQTCQAGMWSWRDSESCPFGCDPSIQACQGSNAQCSGFETRCVNGGTSVQMCNGGLWGPTTACANGCDTQSQQCSTVGTPVCLDGATRCINDGTAQQDCENGQWGSVSTCPGGCNTSTQQCNAGGPECAEGQRRCVNGSNSVQFCEAGAWGGQQFCPYGCDSLTLQCNASSGACSGSYQNKCTTYGARTCSSAGDSLVCEPAEPDGCLTWQIAETCGSGCSAGTCNTTVCSGSDICGFDGARRCSSASFEQVCSTAGDGCLRWVAPLGGGACDSSGNEVCSNGLCQQVSCLFNSDCAASSRFCDAGYCAPCATSDDCSAGYSCQSNGRCQPVF